MNYWRNSYRAIGLSSLVLGTILSNAASSPVVAQNEAIFVCIKKYRELGISPDVAAQECRNQDFTAEQKTCINQKTNNQAVFQAQSGPNEKPANISDRAMQQAGASFQSAASACAVSGYCLSLNGAWISQQSSLRISVTDP